MNYRRHNGSKVYSLSHSPLKRRFRSRMIFLWILPDTSTYQKKWFNKLFVGRISLDGAVFYRTKNILVCYLFALEPNVPCSNKRPPRTGLIRYGITLPGGLFHPLIFNNKVTFGISWDIMGYYLDYVAGTFDVMG